MPASKKDRFFEGVIAFFLCTLLVLASLGLPGFMGLSLRIMLAGVMAVSAAMVVVFLKPFKILPLEKEALLKYMIILGLLYVGLYYATGAYAGYAENIIKFGWFSIGNFIIPIGITIVSSEIIRANFLCFTDKYSKVIAYIIGVLSEVILYIAVYDVTRLDQLLLLIGLIAAALTSNLLYNFVSNRFGAKPVIAYRMITVLYAYIIPVLPNIYAFAGSFYKMIAPLFVYWVIDRTFIKHEAKALGKSSSLFEKAFGVVACIVMVGFIMLVSCQFSVGALVVGSSSMTGSVDMGDVVIMHDVGSGEELHEGDIIVFNRDNERIIHRIVKISTVAGKERYYTKGDVNEKEDEKYVTRNDLVGRVMFKVPAVGWPTLWLKEVFKV